MITAIDAAGSDRVRRDSLRLAEDRRATLARLILTDCLKVLYFGDYLPCYPAFATWQGAAAGVMPHPKVTQAVNRRIIPLIT